MMKGIPAVRLMPDRVMTWGGLFLEKDDATDSYRKQSGEFEWEVDASLNEEDMYEARVYRAGLKLSSGEGATRHAALSQAIRNLSTLCDQVTTEVIERKKGNRDYQKNNNARRS